MTSSRRSAGKSWGGRPGGAGTRRSWRARRPGRAPRPRRRRWCRTASAPRSGRGWRRASAVRCGGSCCPGRGTGTAWSRPRTAAARRRASAPPTAPFSQRLDPPPLDLVLRVRGGHRQLRAARRKPARLAPCRWWPQTPPPGERPPCTAPGAGASTRATASPTPRSSRGAGRGGAATRRGSRARRRRAAEFSGATAPAARPPAPPARPERRHAGGGRRSCGRRRSAAPPPAAGSRRPPTAPP